jgi:hypothetical protein
MPVMTHVVRRTLLLIIAIYCLPLPADDTIALSQDEIRSAFRDYNSRPDAWPGRESPFVKDFERTKINRTVDDDLVRFGPWFVDIKSRKVWLNSRAWVVNGTIVRIDGRWTIRVDQEACLLR